MNRILLVIAVLLVGCHKVGKSDAPESKDAIDISQMKFASSAHHDRVWEFPVTAEMADVRHDGRDVFFKMVSQPEWDRHNSGVDDNIDGCLYILWYEGDTLWGGHYDWCRPADTFKNYHTIRDPAEKYFQHFPRKGQVWYHLKTNNPKCPNRERSNVVKAGDLW